jgi:carbamoyltransferase
MPLDKMLRTQQTRNIAAVLDLPRILKRYGFDKASINFSYHHMAHAIPAYFFSEFDDALLYTADGMGDGISSANPVRRGQPALLPRYRLVFPPYRHPGSHQHKLQQ